MSDEQDQINALPGGWSKIGHWAWQLDASGLGVGERLDVTLCHIRERGLWMAHVDPAFDDGENVYVVTWGITARGALEGLARQLGRLGSDLMEASHELINGR